ncbi:uncharacterized protein Fot_28002 [Forsythia ovata]|uniref:Uncharacterized protein n=1 Tax=Forsythia ovata TaxID=205694 RepID=A0ABD1TMR8_9LAMI
MDNFGGVGLSTVSKTVRRRRSNMNRRPSNESQSPQDYHDSLPSDHINDALSDDSGDHDASPWMKELNLNQCISRASYTNLTEAETVLKNDDVRRRIWRAERAYKV